MMRCLALALVATAAIAAEQPDLKGLRAGMSEQELLAAMPTLRCRTPPVAMGDRICSDGKNTLVGQPAILSVTLINDRTARIIFFFAADHANEVADAITKKYGEPSGSTSLPTRSSSGIELTRKLTTWNVGDESQVELSHLPGTDRGTWLNLTDKTGRNEVIMRMKQEKDRKAKDL